MTHFAAVAKLGFGRGDDNPGRAHFTSSGLCGQTDLKLGLPINFIVGPFRTEPEESRSLLPAVFGNIVSRIVLPPRWSPRKH